MTYELVCSRSDLAYTFVSIADEYTDSTSWSDKVATANRCNRNIAKAWGDALGRPVFWVRVKR